MTWMGNLPHVVAGLTFTPVGDRRANLSPGCWEEDRPLVAGEQVLVADSGAGPYEVTMTAAEPDSTLLLAVQSLIPTRT